MKKLLMAGLAVVFMAASGMALADGAACAGKCKGKGHHAHKKGSKTESKENQNGNKVPSK